MKEMRARRLTTIHVDMQEAQAESIIKGLDALSENYMDQLSSKQQAAMFALRNSLCEACGYDPELNHQ